MGCFDYCAKDLGSVLEKELAEGCRSSVLEGGLIAYWFNFGFIFGPGHGI